MKEKPMEGSIGDWFDPLIGAFSAKGPDAVKDVRQIAATAFNGMTAAQKEDQFTALAALLAMTVYTDMMQRFLHEAEKRSEAYDPTELDRMTAAERGFARL